MFMTKDNLMNELEDLERRILAQEPTRRHLFQPEFHNLVERMIAAGFTLPDQVKQLDDMLTDAAIEAQFDNMPV
jgi:hypothetical protein